MDESSLMKKDYPELYKLYDKYPVFLYHIKAHTNKQDEHSLGNEKADKLAQEVATKAKDVNNNIKDSVINIKNIIDICVTNIVVNTKIIPY